jgi:hypothetical protein
MVVHHRFVQELLGLRLYGLLSHQMQMVDQQVVADQWPSFDQNWFSVRHGL